MKRALTLLLVSSFCLVSCEEGSTGSMPASVPDRQAVTGPVWFDERAEASGIDFRHWVGKDRNFYMPETVTGGVGLIDYDLDGDLDVYLVQGGDLKSPETLDVRNRLYRNRGDATFEDVTDEAGVGDAGYGMGCAIGDYDGDGDPDIFVTNVGPNVLYRNDGQGTFTDVSVDAGVDHPGLGSSCAFGDLNGDGNLDLFVTNYINWSIATELDCSGNGGQPDYCSPKNYQASAPDLLYMNQGDGTFREVGEERGTRNFFGNGLGVAFGDFDGDGSQDIYVTNDGNPNQLWLNDGEGQFVNKAVGWGCSVNVNGLAEAGMGVAVVDCDQDGDLDLFMTHLRAETNTYYENRNGYFKDMTALSGLASASRDSTGFGLGFCDFDHDGTLDLYVANGRVTSDAEVIVEEDLYAEPNQVFRGVGGIRFEEVFPRGGTQDLLVHSSRGAAIGDLDNDGDMDLVVNNSHGPAYLLINVVADPEAWVQFRVLDAAGRIALGARVEIELDGTARFRTVQRNYSYCTSNDPRVHFGLGKSRKLQTVKVRWLGGATEEFGPFEAGSAYELRAGTGR